MKELNNLDVETFLNLLEYENIIKSIENHQMKQADKSKERSS